MLINVVQRVNASQIRGEKLDGVDYLVVSSKTMPDDIVMNGILYPAEQINNTIQTINESPAPLGHPKIDGIYVSAYSQRAQNAFNKAGGFNVYKEKQGDSHLVEKWFDKERLESTDQGQSLLKAINENLPINSSTGVIISTTDESGSNKYGKYSKIANISHFDHDAVLINEAGAATPEQGVGLMVNSQEQMDVLFVNLSEGLDMSNSANVFMCKMQDELTKTFGGEYKSIYLIDHNANVAIYELYEDKTQKHYSVKYEVIDDVIKLYQPIEVEGAKVYEEVDKGLFANFKQKLAGMFNQNPLTSEQDDPMKEKMIAALNSAGIETEGLNDDQLFEAYNSHSQAAALAANTSKGITADEVSTIVATQIGLALKANAEDAELVSKGALVDKVIAANSNFTAEDKDLLLATPEVALNALLPAKRAAQLKEAMQSNQSTQISSALPE